MVIFRSTPARRTFAVAAAGLLCSIAALGHAAPASHVIVIGCDGMSPDGIRNADTPNMDRMMREGAYTMHARPVLATSSSPNWAAAGTVGSPTEGATGVGAGVGVAVGRTGVGVGVTGVGVGVGVGIGPTCSEYVAISCA